MISRVLLGVAALAVVLFAVNALRDDESAPAPFVTTAPDPVRNDTVAAPPVALPAEAAPAPATPAPAPPASGPGGPEFIDDQALMAVLDEYGFERLESAWRRWAALRGYPVSDASGAPLYDQPYEQYDEQTLRGLSDNGDMWASQILADRIATQSPAEAIELYRRAATAGSVYAMHEMAALYQRVSDKRREVDFSSGEQALEQVYAMRDAPVAPEVAGYAWTVVAEMAGSEPMFGALASSQLEQRMQAGQIDEACAMARGLYDELMSQRSARGLGEFERTPPPLVYEDPSREQRCPGLQRPLDLTGCRQLVVQQPATPDADAGPPTNVWVCDEG